MITSVFNLCWTTFFLEIWKRKSSELSYMWGILDMDLIDEQRPQFHGTPSTNPITKKQELYYSKYYFVLRKKFLRLNYRFDYFKNFKKKKNN